MIMRTVQGTYFPTTITRVDYDEEFTEKSWLRVEQPACINGVTRVVSMPLPDAVAFIAALIDAVGSAVGPDGLAKISAAVDMAIVEQNSSLGALMNAYTGLRSNDALERLAANVYRSN